MGGVGARPAARLVTHLGHCLLLTRLGVAKHTLRVQAFGQPQRVSKAATASPAVGGGETSAHAGRRAAPLASKALQAAGKQLAQQQYSGLKCSPRRTSAAQGGSDRKRALWRGRDSHAHEKETHNAGHPKGGALDMPPHTAHPSASPKKHTHANGGLVVHLRGRVGAGVTAAGKGLNPQIQATSPRSPPPLWPHAASAAAPTSHTSTCTATHRTSSSEKHSADSTPFNLVIVLAPS